LLPSPPVMRRVRMNSSFLEIAYRAIQPQERTTVDLDVFLAE